MLSTLSEDEMVQVALNNNEDGMAHLQMHRSGSPSGLLRPPKLRNIESSHVLPASIHTRFQTEPSTARPVININSTPSPLTQMIYNDNNSKLFSMG